MTYLTEVVGDPGPDVETNAFVEVMTVQASSNIEKGEIVMFGSTGVLQATGQSTTALGPYYVALDKHTYSTSTTEPTTALGAAHQIRVGVVGVYDAQMKTAGTAIVKGQWLEVSSTGGELQVCDRTYWFDPVGIAMEDVASTCYSCLVLMGAGNG